MHPFLRKIQKSRKKRSRSSVLFWDSFRSKRLKYSKRAAAGTPGRQYDRYFMKTKGILVVGTGSVTDADGMEREPSLGILKSGDYIVKADGKEISTKEEILEIVEKSQGKGIRLTIIRNGFEKECQILPVCMQDGSCKLGVWVRDDTQGLGTMTYVDGQKQYGALGHGISDVDTGLLMQIRDGKLYRASVGAVKKGEKGNPGELSGTIYYRDDQILGTITSNSETGIKGMLYAMPQELSGHSFVQTAYRQEVHTGNASIYCSIDGSVKEYTVEIEKNQPEPPRYKQKHGDPGEGSGSS